MTSDRLDRPYDLITFGETMIRLAVPDHRRLEDVETLDLSIGGTESNLAIALARLGRRVTWFSALPRNPLGRKIETSIRKHGVDTSHVVWEDSGRAGVYYLEPGATPRPTRVIYDRSGAAVAELDAERIDPEIVRLSRLLHLTGITPALSENCARICERLATAARAAGTLVTLDVNYRSLLWEPDDARSGLAPLLACADVIFCGMADARTIWNLTGDASEIAAGLLDLSVAGLVVVTAGEAGVTARTRDGAVSEQAALPVEVVDPVGAGDAFAAGFLHSWLENRQNINAALRSGVALASLQMTMPGDLVIVTAGELDELLQSMGTAGQDIVR